MVIYSLLAACTRIAAAPVTVFLILTYFTPVLQGYYYAFASLLSIHNVVDMGMSQMLVIFASHEWVYAREQPDARDRLWDLQRFALRYFGLAALLTVPALMVAGPHLWINGKLPAQEWVSPWYTVIMLLALKIIALPQLSILEGCQQVLQVHRVRFWEALLGAVVSWSIVSTYPSLWVHPGGFAVQVLVSGSAVLFLSSRLQRELGPRGNSPPQGWLREIWPLQWRQALCYAAGWAASLFPALLFQLRSAEEAGRMGLTFSLVTALGALPAAYLNSRFPLLSERLARGDLPKARQFFRQISVRGCAAALAVAIGGWGVQLLVVHWSPHWESRFLPWPLVLLLCLTVPLQIVTTSLTMWVRAQKREPFVVSSIVCNLAILFCTLWLGPKYGATGAVCGYFAIMLCLQLPWVFTIYRRYSK